MILQSFFSRTARHASEMCKHVFKLLNHQRDILTPQAVEAVEKARREVITAINKGTDKEAMLKQMSNFETVANKWLKSYPHASIRENIEVFLVAVAVAMGIRTFFLQPFKIPTGSMQPTLYGITHQDLRKEPDAKIPTGIARFYESWVYGPSYYHEVAEGDGTLPII